MNLPIHKYGKTERRKFGKINEVIDIPNLVEIQKESYDTFINEGIAEIFEDYSPITDFSDHFELHFLSHEFGDTPKYDEKECHNRDATYALPLRVKVRLHNKVKDEIIDSVVFMGDFPLMTENGSFIINGAERVIVSQLVRSPGVNNVAETDKTGKKIYETTVIPNRGAWLEFKQDPQGVLWVSVDRKRKLTATVLLRALGYGSNRALEELFGGDKMIAATIERDEKETPPIKSESDGLIALYRRLRPGEVPTEDSVRQHLNNLFFDPRRYDVVKVGRYKFNKKLNLAYRLPGCRVADDIFHPETGELLASKGEKVSEEQARAIQNAGIGEVYVLVNDPVDGEIRHKIISNNTVDFSAVSAKDPKAFGLLKTIYYPNFKFSREIAQACAEMSEEEVAEKYLEEINAVYYVRETAPEADEKQEEKKNREKRRENRLKFVKACKLFHELLARDDAPAAQVDLAAETRVMNAVIETNGGNISRIAECLHVTYQAVANTLTVMYDKLQGELDGNRTIQALVVWYYRAEIRRRLGAACLLGLFCTYAFCGGEFERTVRRARRGRRGFHRGMG